MSFQKIVMIVAIVVLILTLTMIGIALRNQQKNVIFPPVLADCPDYWEGTVDNKCKRGDVYNKGICPNNIVDFNAMNNCNKYDWATACEVTWDGISNNPDICDTSS